MMNGVKSDNYPLFTLRHTPLRPNRHSRLCLSRTSLYDCYPKIEKLRDLCFRDENFCCEYVSVPTGSHLSGLGKSRTDSRATKVFLLGS